MGGADFRLVLASMEQAGYDVEWRVFNSANFVPQNRERVYIVGSLRGRNDHRRSVLSGFDAHAANLKATQHIKVVAQRGKFRQANIISPSGISPTLTTAQGGWRVPHILVDRNGKPAIRRLTPRECWRLQGFTDDQFDRAKATGLSDTQLYKQAGNAVTVPVVALIASNLQ